MRGNHPGKRADISTTTLNNLSLNMRSSTLTGGCLAVSASVSLLMLIFQQSPQPIESLVVDTPVYDFGVVEWGTQSAIVHLTNESDAVLLIKHVDKSCTCTDVRLPAGDLMPNAIAVMECDVNTVGRSGPTEAILSVRYRPKGETKDKRVGVIFRANVTPEYSILPAKLQFQKDEHTRMALINIKGAIVLSAEATHKSLTVNVSHDGLEVTVSYDHELHSDDAEMAVLLTVDNATQPTAKLPIVFTDR